MALPASIAAQAAYWVAGVLTLIAATIVTVAILIASRSGSEDR